MARLMVLQGRLPRRSNFLILFLLIVLGIQYITTVKPLKKPLPLDTETTSQRGVVNETKLTAQQEESPTVSPPTQREQVPVTQRQKVDENAAQLMTVVTAADSNYFSGLTNFVGSVKYWSQQTKRPLRLVVYDLGLDDRQRHTITTKWCHVDLISHFAQNLGTVHTRVPKKYAWKPLAIKDAVDRYGNALWLDAGSTVNGPLDRIFELLTKNGYFFVQGQDLNMAGYLHPGILEYYSLKSDWVRNLPSYSGNTNGWIKDSEVYREVLVPWVECAMSEECIAPAGSSTGNHRFDQSALSILVYKYRFGQNLTGRDPNLSEENVPVKHKVVSSTELLAASKDQLKPCFEVSERTVWTSRQSEICYQEKATLC